ncbi:MAG: DICT sensory domain-containing protein [Chloroflexota bacterium]
MSISLYRAVAGQYNDLRQVQTVPLMNTISHLIEDQVIEQGQPLDFYAGFQRFSHFPDQLRRYQRLGAVCRRVYVFGIPDVPPPTIPGIEFIRIAPTDPLANEWFLIVNTPTFWTTLLTQEVSGRDPITGGRRFDGVWSYDQEVIDRATLLISQQLGQVYQPITQRDAVQQSKSIAQISGRLLGDIETVKRIGQRRWARLATIQQVVSTLSEVQNQAWDETMLVDTLRSVAQVLHTNFGVEDVAVAMQDRSEVYRVVTADAQTPVANLTIRANDGPSGRAMQEGNAVTVADAIRQRERDPLVPGATSIIATPLIGQRQTYGVLTIGHTANQTWEDEDVQTMQAVAKMLTQALDQALGQSPNDSLYRERARRLEQAIIGLRAPVAQALTAQQQVRALAAPGQEQSLAQSEQALSELARVLRVTVPDTQPNMPRDRVFGS